jgi:hypothetical protein
MLRSGGHFERVSGSLNRRVKAQIRALAAIAAGLARAGVRLRMARR